MKLIKKSLLIISTLMFLNSCELLNQIEIPEGTGEPGLTEEEVARGLKQALNVGTENAVQHLSKENALYGDPKLRIPFPQDAVIVEQKLRELGMGQLVDNFIEQMNHGAEEAMTKAKPVFVEAISEMTIQDAWSLLKGEDNAATMYFKNKTYDKLYDLFKPQLTNTLNQMQVTQLWTEVMTAYNKLPFQEKVNADLPDYVTKQALDRLFMQIQLEEEKIRENPQARITELLKKVFSRQ
ncbi:MAG: DUF4197 domain-containing protein [Bacteroidota bacterium]